MTVGCPFLTETDVMLMPLPPSLDLLDLGERASMLLEFEGAIGSVK